MSSQTIATLTVHFPDGKQTVYTLLDGQTLKIGRDESSDIVVPDAAASRLHSSISASVNGVVIADRSSLNGTFVNGRQLEGMKDLCSGDTIDIGSCKIAVELRSQEMIDSLSSGASSRAMTAQMRPVAVTVLVATVNNYYDMSENLPTDAVVGMLYSWLEEVKGIVEKNQGGIDKVIENSLVAVWSGQQREQQAVQATYSAQQVLNTTDNMISEGQWKFQSESPWDISLAVSTGHGLKGTLGASSKQSEEGFTMVGDPINEAFELQSHLKKFETNNIISSETARLGAKLFSYDKLGKVDDPSTGSETEIFSLQTEYHLE